MALKRKRSAKARASITKAVGRMSRAKRGRLAPVTLVRSVQRLNRMIETKETAQTQAVGTNLPHNNIVLLTTNPFVTALGAGDPMAGTGNRIGDSISVQGLLLKGMMECSFQRSHVHFRIMLVRGAKGDFFNCATFFKGIVDNKLIDQMNNERYTIIASKRMTIDASNAAPNVLQASGVPLTNVVSGITGRPFSMWIPGKKFGRNGVIKYEDASTSQVKFYDYRIVILAYDWYGTPQDINNVGLLNSFYTKLYYKDA